jgi:hypothetical protein
MNHMIMPVFENCIKLFFFVFWRPSVLISIAQTVRARNIHEQLQGYGTDSAISISSPSSISFSLSPICEADRRRFCPEAGRVRRKPPRSPAALGCRR